MWSGRITAMVFGITEPPAETSTINNLHFPLNDNLTQFRTLKESSMIRALDKRMINNKERILFVNRNFCDPTQ
jgi:hypothetical protein